MGTVGERPAAVHVQQGTVGIGARRIGLPFRHVEQDVIGRSEEAGRDRLERVRPGNIVRLRGQLVSVLGPNNFTWTSSLTRADTGNP